MNAVRLLTLCLLVGPNITLGSISLEPPERSYKILILIPSSPHSHRNVFIPLAEALADRGHQVEILSYLQPFHTTRNITQYVTGFIEPPELNMFEIQNDPGKELTFFKEVLVPATKYLHSTPIAKEIYSKRKTYDLFIVDHIITEMAYPFVHEMPFITVATVGVDSAQSAMFGNVLNPSYVHTILMSVTPPLTLYKRALNLATHMAFPFLYNYWLVIPAVQQEISKLFPDLPPLLDIQRNQSLTLMNSHFSTEMAVVPLLPSQVEVGAMHCRPGEPLPHDLDDWLKETGDDGVIYFSLGSITKGKTMPTKFRDIFVKAFSQIKQKVIWKYEEHIPNLSKNVMIKKWLPQQDILSDPRVKIFISHGGLLGTQEAIYHAKPILVLPIYGDQPKNAQTIVSKGIGISLDWDDLNPTLLIDTITTLINNSSYKRNSDTISRILRDQLQSPKDKAVFWTEYVIKHNGATHLRSPAADLSWIEFLLLDIICLALFFIIISWYITKSICKMIFKKLLGSGAIKSKRE
ncbi:hypothetical protein SK128_007339 [Halocaridina rubra]|uniref:UDP-glucuronosyltransferase n=1 Tax=Halocaridina rubra TaxID=373956 RepID=A0AAN8WRP0_HALRR